VGRDKPLPFGGLVCVNVHTSPVWLLMPKNSPFYAPIMISDLVFLYTLYTFGAW
jgi:hypothetical protein